MVYEKIDKRLKRCPMCGHKAFLGNYIIECSAYCACGLRITKKHSRHSDSIGIAAVIKAWNKRV